MLDWNFIIQSPIMIIMGTIVSMNVTLDLITLKIFRQKQMCFHLFQISDFIWRICSTKLWFFIPLFSALTNHQVHGQLAQSVLLTVRAQINHSVIQTRLGFSKCWCTQILVYIYVAINRNLKRDHRHFTSNVMLMKINAILPWVW